MYPTKENIWHFKQEIDKKDIKNIMLIKQIMIENIKYNFRDYNILIILENGKVIGLVNNGFK